MEPVPDPSSQLADSLPFTCWLTSCSFGLRHVKDLKVEPGGGWNVAHDDDHGAVHRSQLAAAVALDRRRLEETTTMDTPRETGLSLETVMKRGALVCVVALGGAAVGLAIWAVRRWQDEREYQAWRASVTADPYRRDRNGYPVGAQLGLSRSR